jgi:hypothetical protein
MSKHKTTDPEILALLEEIDEIILKMDSNLLGIPAEELRLKIKEEESEGGEDENG